MYIKKHIQYFALIILTTTMLIGCSPPSANNKDPFFQSTGDYDFNRLPLMEPYDAIKVLKTDAKLGWEIDLYPNKVAHKIIYYSGISDVRKISVKNGVIMAYTPYIQEYLKGKGIKSLHWFVIIPDQSTEIGFDNEVDFLNYLQSNGIREPVWINPDSAFQQFEKTGCLDWIPDCK